MRRTLLVVLALAMFGCAVHRAAPSNGSPPPQEPAAENAPAEPVASSADASVAPKATVDGYLGVVERAGLVEIVEQGLGRVLARLKLAPVMEGKRFRGFRVTQLDPQWAACGIQEGDVLLRLNGQSIERPEQAMTAFESLRVASEIALELQRNEATTVLRYRVE
jgi:S1-C subfamily serine protease